MSPKRRTNDAWNRKRAYFYVYDAHSYDYIFLIKGWPFRPYQVRKVLSDYLRARGLQALRDKKQELEAKLRWEARPEEQYKLEAEIDKLHYRIKDQDFYMPYLVLSFTPPPGHGAQHTRIKTYRTRDLNKIFAEMKTTPEAPHHFSPNAALPGHRSESPERKQL